MATIPNTVKYKLEHLFGMASGYVLDFTNATFADFASTAIGIDPYERYDGSKATILRQIWQHEGNADVAKLNLELLDRWETLQLTSDEPSAPRELQLAQQIRDAIANAGNAGASPVELGFLAQDITIDLSQLPLPVTMQQAVQQRLDEIELCLKAEAPLAVIFLCGSTLEGLLMDAAMANASLYTGSTSAPTRRSQIRPLAEWTLENLIVTSRELGLIGEDVVKHAHAVRDFRNYIHPRQQVREGFTPRMVTAEIAFKVLQAAIVDLGMHPRNRSISG